MAGEGYQGGIDLTIPTAMTIAAFFAISFYNVVDINIQIFYTFKRYTGLYFWSLLAASWGIVVHSIGFLLKFFRLCQIDYLNIVIITLGGVPMVIGQSVVLYSRLHLLVRDKRTIRWILIMIASSFFLFTIPPTILNFGANSTNPEPFLHPFEVYEKIALIGFCSQEFTISGLYMWETWKLLRIVRANQGNDIRRVMRHIIYVNILVVLMDLALLGIVFGNKYQIETTYKSAMYSTKLKLEFPVLNQLRNLAVKRSCSCDHLSPYHSSFLGNAAVEGGNTKPSTGNTTVAGWTAWPLTGRVGHGSDMA